jgi:hypothetical protein
MTVSAIELTFVCSGDSIFTPARVWEELSCLSYTSTASAHACTGLSPLLDTVAAPNIEPR